MENGYSQSKEESAEILRLILQKMVKHPAAFTPPTYAVWYEFLAGINPRLNEEMSKLLDADEPLSNETTQHLFDRYISEINPEAQNKFRQNMQKLLDGLASQANSTSEDTRRFNTDLDKFGTTLNNDPATPLVHQLVGAIMQGTELMQSSVSALQDKLLESKSKVEKLQQELQNARSEALIDPLTKALNRRGLDVQMKKLVAKPEFQGKRISFLMLDIDFFKKINDNYGHMFGDRVICGITAALTAQVKGRDSVARLGGEEFAVVLPNTLTQDAFTLAEQIRKSIEQAKIRRSAKHEDVGGITVSIGIADCEITGDWQDALSRADTALYVSKKMGRNKTTVYDSSMEKIDHN